MIDILHRRDFNVSENINIKNESIVVFLENALVYSWVSCAKLITRWAQMFL